MNAEAIQSAYEAFIEVEERRSPSGPRQYTYASSWSACTRQMALELLRPDVKPQFGVDTLANFRRGNDRARDIKADMTRIGRFCEPSFDVVGAEERFELRDPKGRVVIVGKVDFRLRFRGQRGSAPVETKSWHPNLVAGVKRFDDLFSNRWTRKGAHQLLSYMYATEEPVGFMLLDRPGIPRPLEVNLYDHLDKIEDFLRRAEVAQDAREGVSVMPHPETGAMGMSIDAEKYLPPYIDDPAECRLCPFFGSVCNPPIKHEGAAIITDEAVLAQIERHDALDEARREYAGIHDDLADHFKKLTPKTFYGGNKKQIIAGKYVVEAGFSKNTTSVIPETVETLHVTAGGTIEIRQLPFKSRFQKSDPAGKFGFSITKVSD